MFGSGLTANCFTLQSALRFGHSIWTAQIKVTDVTLQFVDSGSKVVLDISTAFDTVNHQILHTQSTRLNFWTSGMSLQRFNHTCMRPGRSSGWATDRTCKGSAFVFPISQYVQRLKSRAITYGAVGLLVLRWSLAQQSGFISFRCPWIQSCAKALGKDCVRTICPISPSYSSFRGRKIGTGNNSGITMPRP